MSRHAERMNELFPRDFILLCRPFKVSLKFKTDTAEGRVETGSDI